MKLPDAELDAYAAFLREDHPEGRFRLFPGAGLYTCAHPLLFHWTLILGWIGDRETYADRWCFSDKARALAALEGWNPILGGEPHGWHRHPASGRRRPGGDPVLEYVEP